MRYGNPPKFDEKPLMSFKEVGKAFGLSQTYVF